MSVTHSKLIYYQGSELKFEDSTLQYIRTIPGKFKVVSVFGLYRIGKTTLLNHLIGKAVFKAANGDQATTNGIDVYYDNVHQILFLDIEGAFDTEKANIVQDKLISAVTMCLSSTSMLLHVGHANMATTQFLTNTLLHIFSSQNDCNIGSMFDKFLLLWVYRGVSKNIAKVNNYDKESTIHKLLQLDTISKQSFMKILDSINFEVATLSNPGDDYIVGESVSKAYDEDAKSILDRIRHQDVREFTGGDFSDLCQALSGMLSSKSTDKVYSSILDFIEHKKLMIAHEYLATMKERLTTQGPMSRAELKNLHQSVLQDKLDNLRSSIGMFVPQVELHMQSMKARVEKKSDISFNNENKPFYQYICHMNREITEQRCSMVIDNIFHPIVTAQRNAIFSVWKSYYGTFGTFLELHFSTILDRFSQRTSGNENVISKKKKELIHKISVEATAIKNNFYEKSWNIEGFDEFMNKLK